MALFSKLTAVAVAVGIGVGASAGSASAYSISGGTFNGTGVGTFSFGGYPVICSSASYVGYASGVSDIDVVPTFSACDLVGFPADVYFSGAPWRVGVWAGPSTWGEYRADLFLTTTSRVEVEVPILGCVIWLEGPQYQWSDGVMRNVGFGDAELEISSTGLEYIQNGSCPFSNGSDGEFSTNGAVYLPGVTVSP